MPVRVSQPLKWSRPLLCALLACVSDVAIAQPVTAERLDRGVVAAPASSSGGILVSWRDLANDPAGTTFIVYRDAAGSARNRYTVAAVASGQWQAPSAEGPMAAAGYLEVPLELPSPRTAPDGIAYTYEANDVSVGDLDGEGRYELVV